MSPTLSIIIPAYNESERIGKTLRDALAYLDAQTSEHELIVMDDGSKDDTQKIAEEIFAAHAQGEGRTQARVIRYEPNRGKGYAVRTGLLAARAPIAVFTDADLSTPMTETPKVVAPIRAGQFDLIFGSRALDRSLIGVHQPWRREQGGRVFNLIVRLATRLPYWDTQCGFKAFRMDVCRPILEAATIDRFGFDVELLYVAHLAGLRVKEWPVRWDHNEGGKVDYASDSFKMVNEVRAIRRLAREGFYDKAMKETRDIAARAPQFIPSKPGDEMQSDVSPEVAGQRIGAAS